MAYCVVYTETSENPRWQQVGISSMKAHIKVFWKAKFLENTVLLTPFKELLQIYTPSLIVKDGQSLIMNSLNTWQKVCVSYHYIPVLGVTYMWVLHPTDVSVHVTKEKAKDLLINRTAENRLGWEQNTALCPSVGGAQGKKGQYEVGNGNEQIQSLQIIYIQ